MLLRITIVIGWSYRHPRAGVAESAFSIVGGLASEPATLFLLPAIPSLIVRDTRGAQSQHSPADEQERDTVHEP